MSGKTGTSQNTPQKLVPDGSHKTPDIVSPTFKSNLPELLLDGSRFSQSKNGAQNGPCSNAAFIQPTSGQKWWAAILLGLIFFILSSRVAYGLTNSLTSKIGVPHMRDGPPFIDLLIHTVLFILIVRLILW
jgi:hypothetical protein